MLRARRGRPSTNSACSIGTSCRHWCSTTAGSLISNTTPLPSGRICMLPVARAKLLSSRRCPSLN
ncbi:hypothetical protein ACFONI_13830 [Aeromonas media]|uniref:hypothetical protein n=1 Tax=Aeromonas media TaxID=651 RepID=UPI003616A277